MNSKKIEMRDVRRRRVRKKVRGDLARPRLSVYRSLRHIYAQLVNDVEGRTLLMVSSLSPELKNELQGTKRERAAKVGELLARKALEKKIKRVVFDRGPFRYHGRVKALAEAAREGGLQF